MPVVLVSAGLLKDFPGPHEAMLRAAGFTLRYPEPWPHQLTEAEVEAHLSGVDAILCGSEPYPARVLAKADRLKVLARLGVGHDAIDKSAATERGIAVAITVGGNHHGVAEHAFALILSLYKQVPTTMQALKAGEWQRATTRPLRGQTLGIVGLGRIGKALVPRAAAFGLKVLATEIEPDQRFIQEWGIELVPLPELLRRADIVSLHTPLTPQTRHLIRAETLRQMKPTAFLINTSRGGVVHEEDLVAALREKRIAGAGLDVFSKEPLEGPPSHPLFSLDNVVLTPHTAGTDEQSRHDMARLAAEAIITLQAGGWPEGRIVNEEVRDRFRWS